VATSGIVRFRDLTEADLEFTARVVTETQPRRPATAAEELVLRRATEKMADVRRLLVEVDGTPAGWLSVLMFHNRGSEHAWVNVFVPGAGAALFEAALSAALEQARGIGATTAGIPLWEHESAGIETLLATGWEQKRRERYWRLELAPEARRLRDQRDAARERLAGRHVTLSTAAEIGGRSAYPAIYEVCRSSGKDTPRSLPFGPIPYEAWLEWMAPPAVVEERVWVAVSDGRPVGCSVLNYKAGFIETGYTGVLAEYRNRGIARGLKLETLVQASELGVTAVETDNDSENAPILHLNQDLGYREVEGRLEFHKSW
jgi:GNAT superfamily N-acetyltransferase